MPHSPSINNTDINDVLGNPLYIRSIDKKRRCRYDGCITVLSRYNLDDKYCSLHQKHIAKSDAIFEHERSKVIYDGRKHKVINKVELLKTKDGWEYKIMGHNGNPLQYKFKYRMNALRAAKKVCEQFKNGKLIIREGK